MKILLLHPPTHDRMPPYYLVESLGVGYLTSVLRRDGHEVEILDAMLIGMSPQQAIDEVLKRDFDCLAITANHEHLTILLATAKAVRKQRKNALLVAGGFLPTLSPEDLLRACPELDFIVRGEGEIPAAEVFGKLSRGEDWRDAPAVAYMNEGVPVLNPIPALVKDLDSLPFPARDAISAIDRPVWARTISSRGCYYACSFCCIKSFYKLCGSAAPRFRSPKNFVDELESVKSTTGIKNFRFSDEDFIGVLSKSRERLVLFAEDLKSRNLNIQFTMETRADGVDEEILKMLKDVGLTDVFLGLESGVQRQLDTFNKHATVEENKRAIETVRKCGLNLRSGLIMFDPYVTISELVENMQFVSDNKLSEENTKIAALPYVASIVLYPGAPLTEQVEKDGLLTKKGMKNEYRFKDPAVRVLAGMMDASRTVRGAFESLRKK